MKNADHTLTICSSSRFRASISARNFPTGIWGTTHLWPAGSLQLIGVWEICETSPVRETYPHTETPGEPLGAAPGSTLRALRASCMAGSTTPVNTAVVVDGIRGWETSLFVSYTQISFRLVHLRQRSVPRFSHWEMWRWVSAGTSTGKDTNFDLELSAVITGNTCSLFVKILNSAGIVVC